MSHKSRIHYSVLNSSISGGIYVLKMLAQFISRSLFIYFLGKELLGLNGLFTSILNMLSLTELGIGTSIIYSLYKPLNEKDDHQIKALMSLYKKIYTTIGIIVGILGLMLVPFLHIFIESASEINGLYYYYILFLLNSVISYFFTYNRSLLNADQRSYISAINDFIFQLLVIIVQAFVLFLGKGYAFFLIVQIIGTLLSNITISIRVNKEFHYLKDVPIMKLPKETVATLKKNTIGNLSSKIGQIIVNGTDSLLISIFVSLASVGIYSNYFLIVSSVQQLCVQITNSITASIGNVAVAGDEEHGFAVYKKHYFVSFSLLYFSSTSLMIALDPFIHLWLGSSYLLSKATMLAIVVNFIVKLFRQTPLVFIDAYGLAWIQRWKAIVESIANLTFSLLFLIVFDLGIVGVMLGTILSSLMTVSWYEPYVVFKYGINKPFGTYLRITSRYLLILLFTLLLTYSVNNQIEILGIVGLLIRLSVGLVIALLIYLIVFKNDDEFLSIMLIVKKLLKR
ncbi:transporter [Enterococcus ureilyticus]|uniref:Transporter n=1 Tax=Enterococcus ureilyticus TaxID=1131292 RepID=A0A1E5HF95_9ENTE|nr:oligosaccharide flippase family protein [Enterococcus ureilyticus]MBM7689347.1 O-antigen/teichoic acid export membrane protein [Enterococcus ureilyticus]OEG23614.1 transporter [Enterococcus ureilyticus]